MNQHTQMLQNEFETEFFCVFFYYFLLLLETYRAEEHIIECVVYVEKKSLHCFS